jgi:hypothetical protein
VAMMFITPAMMPMILSDHPREMLSIMGPVAYETIRPPTPDPAEFIEFARDLCQKVRLAESFRYTAI